MGMDSAPLPVPQPGLSPASLRVPPQECHGTTMDSRASFSAKPSPAFPSDPAAKPSLCRNVVQGGGRLAQLQLLHFSMSRDHLLP